MNNFLNKLPGLLENLPRSAVLVLFFLGIMLGYWTGKTHTEKKNLEENLKTKQLREKSDYKFINPLLECENYEEGNFLRSKKLEKALQEIIEETVDKKQIHHLSVYFRDLNNGLWVGFNEDEKFTPASLLKVPVMIAHFKKEEEARGFLQEEIEYKLAVNKDQVTPNILGSKKLEAGKKYSREKIIESMIVYSDNDAVEVLLENIEEEFLEKVFSDLAIPIPGQAGYSEDFMTVKEYSSFFRILFNSSYLTREMSEKGLDFLSKSEFREGITAGVPEGTVVSHKFGERKFGFLVQLHDCGIVYNQEKPYLLCVMTRGDDFDELKSVIKKVSQEIWKEAREE